MSKERADVAHAEADARALREQVELLVAMGEVQYKELKKIDRAAQTFHRALDLDPRARAAMHELGLLYERSGNWPFALDMLEREAQLFRPSAEAGRPQLLHPERGLDVDQLSKVWVGEETIKKLIKQPKYKF